jgi:Spy/CpxP family protein refolding chaperone
MLRRSFRALTLAVLCTALGLSASSAFAQGGRGGFGGGLGGGGDLALLDNEEVRKELDIVDEQVDKIKALRDKMREEMQAQFAGFRDLSEDDRRTKFEEMRTKMADRGKELQKEVDDILLPQQRDRLSQIALQQRLQRSGTVDGLTSGELAEKIGITDEQKEKMAELAKDAEKELQDKIAKARAEARDKILSGLTPEQKDKVKKMLGSEFRMTQQNRFGQGGRGGQGGQGGRGGQGGNRGNRGGNQQN